ncbi:dephospho-CoA kinase [Telmatospirillum siberiense]|uniref:Dephospho-CoA kinase n=1 Tax=Telmatospirillum siberiense TaxID=382514 RepID=A0A2N3PMZ3_9PROT|nr:dephospho-CoA kinase [Telmatospirillum siberiense]PKU21764.1 dephospho-CoA kinase [Telmatospirillum siberiense]
MIVLGLTGSIGMGKTTAARQLACLGIPVHDADAVVHRLLAKGGAAVAPIGRAFPEALVDRSIDRQRLGARVFGDDIALSRLEAIIHPLVRRQERLFIERSRRRRERLVVLDVPLLFETGAWRRVDAVLVVSCPAFLQEQRVLARPGMTVEKLAAIRQRQIPDSRKRRLADVVIPTGAGRRLALRKLHIAVRVLLEKKSAPRRRRPIDK